MLPQMVQLALPDGTQVAEAQGGVSEGEVESGQLPDGRRVCGVGEDDVVVVARLYEEFVVRLPIVG